jgi:hypothetical protein
MSDDDEELDYQAAYHGRQEVIPVCLIGSPHIEELLNESGEYDGDYRCFHPEGNAEESADDETGNEMQPLVEWNLVKLLHNPVPDFTNPISHNDRFMIKT